MDNILPIALKIDRSKTLDLLLHDMMPANQNHQIEYNAQNFVNLQQICSLSNEKKKYYEWRCKKSTSKFLTDLSKGTQLPVDRLIYFSENDQHRLTIWGHPQVAIHLAYWISPEKATKLLISL